ncbi:putative tRNA-intron endonuclease [Hamiltosporidium tvaerminnensis]|uniref:tRNA-intron lyase n=1 Tax=Hamiltosporidium tvaerminnensis TaxID=1176355 RepID=A0A4Q9LS29_9MICR|nr:putative tRNA-intron endonuclease [Hamiltosporidium tvaerminnensis]
MIWTKIKKNIFIKKLQNDGYTISDGIKYGVDILVYTGNIDEYHAKYAILFFDEQCIKDIVSVQRICSSVGKILVLVDESFNFYEKEIENKEMREINYNLIIKQENKNLEIFKKKEIENKN